MINNIIPIIIFIVIIYGLYKHINIYESFIKGVKDGIHTIINIFPSIFTMGLAINIITKSSLIDDISNYLNIIFIPKEIIPLLLTRPISGSGSISILNNILSTYGVDSYIGRISSILFSSTDTTIYIGVLYLSSINISKSKYLFIVGILTDIFCLIMSIVIVHYIYY